MRTRRTVNSFFGYNNPLSSKIMLPLLLGLVLAISTDVSVRDADD